MGSLRTMHRLAVLLLLSSACHALITQPQLRPTPRMMQPRATALMAAAAAESEGSSVASSTVNLVKAIVGSGVLSLPVGVAAFSSSRKALIPAFALLSVIGTLSAYCFAMVGRVCEATGTSTWGEAWKKTVGEKSAWIPSSFVALLCASASLQYTMVIGDSFSSVFAAVGLPKVIASRNGAIALITGLCTLPLSLLPNLEMLKYTSSLGIGGIIYTAAFMCLRATGHYAPGMALHATVAPQLQPSFSATPLPIVKSVLEVFRSTKVFVLLSILATSFCAHMLAPNFYNELSPGESESGAAQQPRASKLARFNLLVGSGFGLSGMLSAAVMIAGYLTFGAASDGYILNNYAQEDRLAQVARIAVGMSIVCTYPIIHQGLRDTTMEAYAA